MAERDRSRRTTFDRDAERYDRSRPGYPPEVFHDLDELGGLAPGARVLEIGVGTGQATAALAERGHRVTGIELGPNLAALARRRLERFGDSVRIEVGAFEERPPPSEPFDAVVAFTSFHWVDPSTRIERVGAALRPGGVLATVATHHVAGGTQAFFDDAQACYERWDPETTTGYRLPAAQDVAPQPSDELEASGLFTSPVYRRYECDRAYDTALHLDVLSTYSNHIALDPDALAALLGCIGRLLDDRYGGRIEKRYLYELRLARRLPAT